MALRLLSSTVASLIASFTVRLEWPTFKSKSHIGYRMVSLRCA